VATFNFSNITAAQALAITGADTLNLDQGTGATTAVLFSAADQITIMVGERSVVFGLGVASATKTFTGGGTLYIGGIAGDQTTTGANGDGLYGGQGADTLNGGDGLNLLQGNQGADSLTGGSGFDIIYGGQDNDRIVVGAGINPGGSNFGQGNRGDDTISGSPNDNDTLLGGQGNDLINITDPGMPRDLGLLDNRQGFTGGGNDFLNGNLGNDTIFAGEGNDTLMGEGGDDFLQDGSGTNLMIGGDGNDTLIARGENTMNAGTGNDIVGMDAGRYFIQLGDGDDLCLSLDTAAATDGATIDGGAGADSISTSNGADSILGGIGNDLINGGVGADTLSGGAGGDLFRFDAGVAPGAVSSLDRIIDWTAEDQLVFVGGGGATGPGTADNYVESTQADFAAALSFANGQIAAGRNYVSVQVGADVIVFADSAGNDGTADSAVILVGRTLSDIAFNDFD
jgi:Ca2+-binding RTX toxin-like protein